jgi:hypothetical protein
MTKSPFSGRPHEKHSRRFCPQCEAADSAAHPLAAGAIVSLLTVQGGRFVREGIAHILRTSSEPDTYFVRLSGGDPRPYNRLIFPDYQKDPTRFVEIINRHIAQGIGRTF